MQYVVELFVFLLFLIIPPFFSSPTTTNSPLPFSNIELIILFSIALYCFFRSYKTLKNQELCYNFSTEIKFNKKVLFSIFVLFFLLINGFFWQFVASFFPSNISSNVIETSQIVFNPFQIIVFLISAFYEESLYRLFLPYSISKSLLFFTRKEGLTKLEFILTELISVLLFAFGHIYMGIFAVLNGFFAGIVLRFFMLKTKSIFPNVIIHFIYNLVLYLSMFTIA